MTLICIYFGWGGLEFSQAFEADGFVVIVNGLKPLTVAGKSSVSDV